MKKNYLGTAGRVYFSLFLLMAGLSGNILHAATIVNNLRVEYLRNPVGIDAEKPRFSWQIESDERGVLQTAYEITVAKDQAGEDVVWNSGRVNSGKSVHILYEGAPLEASTRYYWKVKSWNQKDQQITSEELAFFETGLMNSGWNDAQWLKATTKSIGQTNPDENIDPATITKYSITMDFEIEQLVAGPIFAAKDAGNFFMWQINLEKMEGKTYLRPHSWKNGNAACHADVDITNKINLQSNTVYHLQIDIEGNIAKTYINNILVDSRENPLGGDFGYGKIGFREDKGEKVPQKEEKAYFDNVLITTEINNQTITLFEEDFSDPAGSSFNNATIESGRLHVVGSLNQTAYAWQKSIARHHPHFTLEMDVTLITDNAGIIFSAKNSANMYMWAINTHDDPSPMIRRHVFTGNNPVASDTKIGAHFSKTDLIGKERHLKIEVQDGIIKTFIDNVLVDTFTDTYELLTATGGCIGFRSYKDNSVNEVAYYDNIVLTTYKKGEGGTEQPVVTFSENFENGNNAFEDTETIVVNGNTKMKMFSKNGDMRVLDDSAQGIPMFRSEFTLNQNIRSARIYSSALGIYDLFINGKRVGTPVGDNMIYDELKPGWTDYKKTVFYSTYDVTNLLQQGANAIGAHVSPGWWQGNIAHGEYGAHDLGFISKLVVEYMDGSIATFVSNTETWASSTEGPVRMGDIYNGESYDARKESDWTKPGFDDSQWRQTAINQAFKGQVKSFTGPTVQVRPTLQQTPVKITQYEGIVNTGSTYGMINIKNTYTAPTKISLKQGQTVIYDLGQNLAGWVKFTVKGKAGAKMKLRFAEILNDEGQSSRGDDGPGGSLYTISLRSAKATLFYTLKGDANGETFNPSMTFFGFRYCEVTATQDIELESLVGEVVGTVNEEGSVLSTSHTTINQLYSNVLWGQRSNFLSIPTDCPQRDERLGWTGDTQIFCRAASYNADVAAFFHKWMGDMRDSQRSDGAYPSVAPFTWGVPFGQAAWADAGIIVPWTVYLMYDDKGILEENYESMEKYMAFLAKQAGGGYNYNGAGTDYGDWVAFQSTDKRYISVCYYAYVAILMEKISKALSISENDNFDQNAKKYQTLYHNIKAEFQKRYINANGGLKQTTQTAYLLALKMNLYPDEEVKTAWIAALNQKIVGNGNRLSTGFVGTGTLNQTLSDVGLTGTAYNLLLQRNNPSWLYSIDQGATTIWERWDSYTKEKGFQDVSMNSFNHYSYGAVSEWMYRYMAGIEADENYPGFKQFILQPSPDFRTIRPTGQEAITKVEATYKSYYGDIKSAWITNDGEDVKYTVTIPANTTATLILPFNNKDADVYEGATPADQVEGVMSVVKGKQNITLTLRSGTYSFRIKEGEKASVKTVSDNNTISLYPNPVDNTLMISTANEVNYVGIFNQSGTLLYAQDHGDPVHMQSFPAGSYLVRVRTNDHSEIIKIVKE